MEYFRSSIVPDSISHTVMKGEYIMTIWKGLKNVLLFSVGLFPTIFLSEKIPANNTPIADGGALAGDRYRVVVSSDIGGTDPDDFQSMVHLLLYADVLDIEGLISSPFGPGRKADILKVIDHYAQDYSNLRTYSEHYPSPESLRAITKQGATDRADHTGYGESTAGSDWVVRCARRDDPRPLYVLIWGGIEDLAQALHDAPDILPKLRVYWIGGPNKQWSVDAYQYIASQHKNLWIIESNATYRGWFVGGNQSGEWGNSSFVTSHIAGHGALGEFFSTQLEGEIKMGDTPSVAWLLKGNPSDPTQPSWGGRFVPAWDHPPKTFHRLTNSTDVIEQFGVLEFELSLGNDQPSGPEAHTEVHRQPLTGVVEGNSVIRFRLSPRDVRKYNYTIQSNIPVLDGRTGSFVSYKPPAGHAFQPASDLPNWWTDDPSAALREGPHIGAKTVSQWRIEFLSDFGNRMDRCKIPHPDE